MDLGLRGKKIIINGGSRGIGRAALEIYASEGCDIAFFSRDAKRVDETITLLQQSGVKVFGDALDMNDGAAYQAWLKSAAERLGGCDIFIHNASSSGAQGTTDWEMTYRLDMMGGPPRPFDARQAGIPFALPPESERSRGPRPLRSVIGGSSSAARHRARRASSSSWRMIDAASRSTRAR